MIYKSYHIDECPEGFEVFIYGERHVSPNLLTIRAIIDRTIKARKDRKK